LNTNKIRHHLHLNGGIHNKLGVPELNMNERTVQKSVFLIIPPAPRPCRCSDVVFGHNTATL